MGPLRHDDPFDPEYLRLAFPGIPEEAPAEGAPAPRHRPGQWFLRGPVPWPWLEMAARLPGKALALSLCLWREAGRQRRRTVKLCLSRVSLGVSEYAARRAIVALERARLVSVRRHPGRGLEVTLLDAPDRKDERGL